MYKQQQTSLIDLDQQIILNLLSNDRRFLMQIQSIVRKVHQEVKLSQKSSPVSSTQASYPWNKIQTNEVIDEIQAVLTNIIDQNLHNILNKEFINISNEILIIRDQVSSFIQQQNQRTKSMELQVNKQIQEMKKKIATNNLIESKAPIQFNNGPRYSRSSAGIDGNQKKMMSQISQLKQQIQKLRTSSISSNSQTAQNQQISYFQESLAKLSMEVKIGVQQNRQYNKKTMQLLEAKIRESSAKDQISSQVRKAIKANMKVFTQELGEIKQKIGSKQQKQANIVNETKQYMATQMKSIWLIIGNIKRRIQHVEESCDLTNASFIME